MWEWHVKPETKKAERLKRIAAGEPEREMTDEEICATLEMMGVLKPRQKKE